jgi:hypothetical protein
MLPPGVRHICRDRLLMTPSRGPLNRGGLGCTIELLTAKETKTGTPPYDPPGVEPYRRGE